MGGFVSSLLSILATRHDVNDVPAVAVNGLSDRIGASCSRCGVCGTCAWVAAPGAVDSTAHIAAGLCGLRRVEDAAHEEAFEVTCWCHLLWHREWTELYMNCWDCDCVRRRTKYE